MCPGHFFLLFKKKKDILVGYLTSIYIKVILLITFLHLNLSGLHFLFTWFPWQSLTTLSMMKVLKWKQRNSSQITLLLSFYLSDLNLITKSSQLCIWVRKGNCTWFNYLLPAQVFIQTVNQTVYTDKPTFTFCLFLFTVQPLKFGWPWPVLAFYRTKYNFFLLK